MRKPPPRVSRHLYGCIGRPAPGREPTLSARSLPSPPSLTWLTVTTGLSCPSEEGTVRVVVAGGTGLLGRALVESLLADNHEVVLLTRRASAHETSPASISWSPDGGVGPWAQALRGAAAIVNLAGHPIGGSRWTRAEKDRILASRLGATRSIVSALAARGGEPAVFVNASAQGYYGSRGDEILTEASSQGRGFLADVCARTEREALRAQGLVSRVVLLRTSLVLDSRGGALPRMLLPFRLFVGGPLGSGRQFMSWIHKGDWVQMVRWVLATGEASGPLNLAAPNPVTNAQFARAVGRVLHRPSWLPAPSFAIRLLLGEMAEGVVLCSQRLVPARALELGYRFRFPSLDAALGDVLAPPEAGQSQRCS